MPRNLTAQSKAIIVLLLVVVAWGIAPRFVKRWSQPLFGEFHAPMVSALGSVHDIRTYWSLRGQSKSELIEAGIELSRLNAAYALRNQQIAFVEAEIGAWETFFNLPSLPEYRYEVARVVQRDIHTWWQTVTIRKGRMHGIRPGHAVIFAGGVVGRIASANRYTAVVELISSPRFRSAAHFDGDLRPVEFSGSLNHGLRPPSASVATVPADIHVSPEQPARLVSSRLGGVFPDGLTLGIVESLTAGPDGLFQRGPVIVDPRLHQLREVAVLVPLLATEGDNE